MGFPLPEFPDGLYDSARKLLDTATRLARAKGSTVKTDKVVHPVWTANPSRSPLELYSDLLRLAQDWVVRYPLLETLGNWGSLDGAPPSGMRYNEVGPSPWADQGAAFPHLLVNGSYAHSGALMTDAPPGTLADPQFMEPLISYGPYPGLFGGELLAFLLPHNLREVCAALTLLLDHPDASLTDVLRVLPGPDFPTGGVLANPEDLESLYRGGEGTIVIRARSEMIDVAPGRPALEIREIPYRHTIEIVVSELAALVKVHPKIGIVDISDQTLAGKMRLLLELQKGQAPQALIDLLYTRGILENRFAVRMVIQRDGQATPVNLMDLLRWHLEQRRRHLRSDARVRAELKLLAERSDARRTTIGAAGSDTPRSPRARRT